MNERARRRAKMALLITALEEIAEGAEDPDEIARAALDGLERLEWWHDNDPPADLHVRFNRAP